MDDGRIRLEHLFTFDCPETEGRVVSAIDINVQNPDLIVVGYGDADINSNNGESKPGLLCFWTLKNPKFPERIIHTDSSVTCCEFSKKQPHLVACGDLQGNISIYNVRDTENNMPIATSRDIPNKHTDIIWEIHWVQRDNKAEALISISGDGRIVEWSMKKGLEYTDLKQLKRETNPNQKDVYSGAIQDQKAGGATFINTGGLSIDFPVNDAGNIYFVATEDCCVYKCSTSFSEKSAMTYYGHMGPIYRVRCNPFWNANDCPVFITCSYDWSVRVWHEKEGEAKLVCHQISNLQQQVNDVVWSPNTSSVFASVANDGRIEIWDLKRDSLAPMLHQWDKDAEGNDIHVPKTIVKFSKTSPVILSGATDGRVGVYRTWGLEHGPVTDEDQQNRLMSAISEEDVSTSKKKADDGEEAQ